MTWGEKKEEKKRERERERRKERWRGYRRPYWQRRTNFNPPLPLQDLFAQSIGFVWDETSNLEISICTHKFQI